MVIASSHMFVFSFWWKIPKGYMALELFFVSARTIKRQHHHQKLQMLAPPHSLHWLHSRWCWQLPAPPHSLHWLLWRWCWQMLPLPHSLNLLLWRWCWQMPAPPHSLHLSLRRWCGQTLRGFFIFAAPAPAASDSSRLRRLRVLLLPTRAVSSGKARCVLSPSSSAPPAAPRPRPDSDPAPSRGDKKHLDYTSATCMAPCMLLMCSSVCARFRFIKPVRVQKPAESRDFLTTGSLQPP
jgi:hypothetical protein